MISAKTKVCCVIGFPAGGSLGPIIHNAGLIEAGIDDDYVYVGMEVHPDKLEDFVSFARTSNICGFSVTLPHKENIMPFLDEIDETANIIGAVNSVVNNGGRLVGYNVDWIGAIEPLKAIVDLSEKNVAVIGAGGAAKAFVHGLTKNNANVTIYNRDELKAKALSDKFNCSFSSLEELSSLKSFDIICNASSIGFSGVDQQNITPVPKEFLNSNQIVFDAIYSPLKTILLKDAEEVGATTVNGIEMLLHQGFAQFEKFFKTKPPKEAMRTAVMEYLNAK